MSDIIRLISTMIGDLSAEKRALLVDLIRPAPEPIAVIGIGCRFPGGAVSPDAYWRLLRDGGDAIGEVPPDRWDASAFYSPDPSAPGKMNVRWGGFLPQIDGFDAEFFGIAPREAISMDPQQRLVLEVAWEALECAGQTTDGLAHSQTGVFIGVSSHDYAEQIFADPERIGAYDSIGAVHSIIANRLSYLFDLCGPSLAVDTICSSSLVAVHLACQSLQSKECAMALAGGVNVILSPAITMAFSKAAALSPDGRCKTFDARANGFVRSEGCGVVVLKRLADALADGDPIFGLVRGSAVNQDGRTTGLAAPNGLAQQAVIRQALARAGVAPEQVSYIEAHGTGTPLGDPIEVEALAEVYGRRPDGTPCVLGAAKANIGHLEAASGIAGLIKVLLTFKHQAIPPHPSLQQLNPNIPLGSTPFVIPTALQRWPSGSARRYASVSAFGAGGTNAHVILEEPPVATSAAHEAPAYLLPISAANSAALRELAQRYHEQLREPSTPPDLGDIAYSASLRRTHHAERLAAAGTSRQQLAEQLGAFLDGRAAPGLSAGRAHAQQLPRLAFVCPGQGAQWPGMARDLLVHEPVFRQSIEQIDQAMREYVPWSLLDLLRAEPAPPELAHIDVIQPTLFAISVGLAALWRSWGITPDAVVGHSMGEVAAAHIAGALSLKDALRIICLRSRLLRRVSGQGAMAVVQRSFEQAEAALAGYTDRLAVAVSNSPRSSVISGDPSALDMVLGQLQAQNIFCRRVQVDVASHSPQMDPLLADLRQALQGIRPQIGHVPIYSTVTASISNGSNMDAEYWLRNLREPVRFASAVQQLAKDGCRIFIELSPHSILLSAVEDGLGPESIGLASMRRAEPGQGVMRESLGALYTHGYTPSWPALYPTGGRCVPLPSYPWQRARYWAGGARPAPHHTPAAQPASDGPRLHPWLDRRLPLALPIFESSISLERQPLLRDHQIFGTPVVPAAAYVEMALAAAREIFGTGTYAISELVINEMLALDADGARSLQLILTPEQPGTATFQFFVRHNDAADTPPAWQTSASGRIARAQLEPPALSPSERPDDVRQRCHEQISAADYYRALGKRGFGYGPLFQGIVQIWRRDGEALGQVQLPAALSAEAGSYQIHPALLDACYQLLMACLGGAEAQPAPDTIYVSAFVDSIRLYRSPGQLVWCHITLDPAQSVGDETLTGHMRMFDEDGQLLLEVGGLCARRTNYATLRRHMAGAADSWLYELQWQEQPRRAPSEHALPLAADRPGSWLILSEGETFGPALADALNARGQYCVLAQPGPAFAQQALSAMRSQASVRADTPADMRQLLAAIAAQGPPLRGVIHSWNIGAAGAEPDLDALSSAQQIGCGSVLALSQALAAEKWPTPPQLWIVTQASQPIALGTTEIAVAQAPVWGLARTLALECADLWGGIVDLAPGAAEAQIPALLDEIARSDGEDQLALRGDRRYVARLAKRGDLDRPPAQLRADRSYLISGGLGGLGLELASWMARHGAQHLVLIGRRGLPERAGWDAAAPDSPAGHQIAAIRAIEALGARVYPITADIADISQIGPLFAQFGAALPPLAGVIHAATAQTPQLLLVMQQDDLRAALRPKVAGTWALHQLSAGQQLDFFVMFSSTTALLGASALAHYGAANSFLDAFAHYRRSHGLPAMSINWGTWDTMQAASAEQRQQFMRSGMRPMPAEQALDIFEALLASPSAQPIVADIDWPTLKAVYESRRRRPLLDLLGAAQPGPAPSASPLLQRLAAATAAARQDLLIEHVRGEVVGILGFDATHPIDLGQGFFQMGMDSLMAVELRKRLQASLNRPLPATMVFNFPNITALSEFLAQELAAALGAPPSNTLEPNAELAPPEPHDDLSEDELATLLAETLQRIH